MTIASKIKSALSKHITSTGTYTTSDLVDVVLACNPHLVRKSVSTALGKLVSQNEIMGLKRSIPGKYEVTFDFIAQVQFVPKKKSKSHKTPVAKAAEAAKKPKKKVGKTFVGMSRDHSGSMASYAKAALADYNQMLDTLKEGNKISETFLSTVICSVRATNEKINIPINEVSHMGIYTTPGSSTPLYDSIGLTIETLQKSTNGRAYPEDAFLVMIITDGQENSSKIWSQNAIVEKIRQLQATDKWTFVFRVPKGQRRVIESWGIPSDNIQEWELSTNGLNLAAAVTQISLAGYYGETRAMGETRSAKFFTDASAVTDKTLQRSLVDVSKEVKLLTVGPADNNVIRPFIKDKLGIELKKGSAFYQLIKTETVQPQKDILIRVKRTGQVYQGPAARDLLGLPHVGNIRVAPGNHGDYDIYVQSTSVNRVLPVGSLVAYWDAHGTAFKTVS